jgi:Domain of unknown function (DUF5076)
MKKGRDLAVPGEVAAAAEAVEVLRAWVANGGLICAVRPTTWKDPGAWGIVLADAARHVANAIRDEVGDEPSATVAKIREMFNRELSAPTDEPKGSFVE